MTTDLREKTWIGSEWIDERKLITGLAVMIGILSLFHIAAAYWGHHFWQFDRAFYLGRESNIPTWFSSLLLIFAAIGAFGCYRLSTDRRHKIIWMLMALGMLFLSCDETAMLHEELGSALSGQVAGLGFFENFKATKWPLLLAPLILPVVIWMGIELRRCLKGSTKAVRLMALGVFVFLGSAMGIELIENFIQGDTFAWYRKWNTLLEESSEMVGVLIISAGFLEHQKFLLRRSRA